METAATQVRSDDSTAEVENSRSLISSPQNVDTNATVSISSLTLHWLLSLHAPIFMPCVFV